MSFECKKLGHIHFLKLPCNECAHDEFTHVALVHSAVLRKRNCAILGECVASGVRYLEAKMYGGGTKILSAVRNREASASRRLLMYYSYQSVTRQVSVVAWASASRRIRYGRFHCIDLAM